MAVDNAPAPGSQPGRISILGLVAGSWAIEVALSLLVPAFCAFWTLESSGCPTLIEAL